MKRRLGEQLHRVFICPKQARFVRRFGEHPILPLPQSVKGGEGPVGRGFALAADQFAAAADIFLHPGGKEKVERIAGHFADVERGAGDHVRYVFGGGLDHQIRANVLAPILGFDRIAIEVERFERVGDEIMGADVGTVPILLVRKKDDLRLRAIEDFSNGGHRFFPESRILLARFWIHAFESVRAGLDQLEAHEVARSLEFFQPAGLAFLLAALRDGDVDDAHFRLPQETQGEPGSGGTSTSYAPFRPDGHCG